MSIHRSVLKAGGGAGGAAGGSLGHVPTGYRLSKHIDAVLEAARSGIVEIPISELGKLYGGGGFDPQSTGPGEHPSFDPAGGANKDEPVHPHKKDSNTGSGDNRSDGAKP